jgi:hypothetical protein
VNLVPQNHSRVKRDIIYSWQSLKWIIHKIYFIRFTLSLLQILHIIPAKA